MSTFTGGTLFTQIAVTFSSDRSVISLFQGTSTFDDYPGFDVVCLELLLHNSSEGLGHVWYREYWESV